MDSRTISLVIPAYDEEESIGGAIREALEALSQMSVRHEVLVVDDGSRDETAIRVEKEFSGSNTVRLLRHPKNLGYGAALRTGFSAAKYDLVAFTDADRQFFLADLELLLEALPGHDVACGYRLNRQDHWLRLLYSGIYNRIVRLLLGLAVRDCDCALKVFRRSALRGLSIQSQGFLVNAELLTRLKDRGASITEVGVRHRARRDGSSTVSPLDAPPVLLALLRFWWSDQLFPASATSTEDLEPAWSELVGSQSNSTIRPDRGLSVHSS